MKPKGNEVNLIMTLTGRLVRLPRIREEELYVSTNQMAELLRVTPQRVGQLCAVEGLLKADRNRFYLPDIVNWTRVRHIAELLEKNPRELSDWGFVDFTLGDRSMPEIDPNALTKQTTTLRGHVRETPEDQQ
jgi:hypothetical protein